MTFWSGVVIPVVILMPGLAPAFLWGSFITIAMTFRKPRRRRLKYDATLIGIWATASYFITMDGGNVSVGAVVIGVPLWIPLLSWIAHRSFIGSTSRKPPPERRARIGYAITHYGLGSAGSIAGMVLLGSLPLLAAFVLFIFAIVRYFSAERLAQTPVVYLRKFMSSDVKDAFHALIKPAISPRRVLVGLTRAKDHRLLVTRRFGLSPARLFVAPDASWQEWVLRELRGAHCAVIDLTDLTNNLLWELDQARAYLPHENVVLLVNSAVPTPDAGRSAVVSYDETKQGRRLAIRALRRWLDDCERRRDALDHASANNSKQ